MAALLALALTVTGAAAAAPPRHPREQAVAARASARVLPGVMVRQGRAPQADGPQAQIRVARDGAVLIEFS